MVTTQTWTDTLLFSVDWVNVRVDCPAIEQLLFKLCARCKLDRNQFLPLDSGLHFYGNGLRYAPAGYKAITLSWTSNSEGLVNTEPDSDSLNNQYGILVSISGDGCRYLDSHLPGGLRIFLNVCNEWHCNCTRIDAAMDVFDRSNPIIPLFEEFSRVAYDPNPGHINIVSGMKRRPGWVTAHENFDPDEGRMTRNVYIGDRNSYKGTCCVYNKKMEVLTGRLSKMAGEVFEKVGCSDYWWRVEYRLKNNELCNKAFQIALCCLCQDVFFFAADNLFWFVDQKYDCSHLSQCEVTPIWADFLDWLENSTPEENEHFVEFADLAQTPYIASDIQRKLRYELRNAMSFKKMLVLLGRCPDLYDVLIEHSNRKLAENQDCAHFLSFCEQLENWSSDEILYYVKGLIS